MKRIMIVPAAVLALWAQPALAGDWDDYTYYEYNYTEVRPGGGDYRAYEAIPAYRVPYVPYGYVISDEDTHVYGTHCQVEREWRRGRYREKIACEED